MSIDTREPYCLNAESLMLPNMVNPQYPSSSWSLPNGNNSGCASILQQMTHREAQVMEHRDNTENIIVKAPNRSIARMQTADEYFGPDLGPSLQTRSRFLFQPPDKSGNGWRICFSQSGMFAWSQSACSTAAKSIPEQKPDSASKTRAASYLRRSGETFRHIVLKSDWSTLSATRIVTYLYHNAPCWYPTWCCNDKESATVGTAQWLLRPDPNDGRLYQIGEFAMTLKTGWLDRLCHYAVSV